MIGQFTVYTNSPSQDYTHPDDHTLPTYKTHFIIERTSLLPLIITKLRGSFDELSSHNFMITPNITGK